MRSFFEPRADREAYRLAIRKWEADRFRPLNLVLNGNVGRTDEKNIELLAWLIDFKARPYHVWLKVAGPCADDAGQQARRAGEAAGEVTGTGDNERQKPIAGDVLDGDDPAVNGEGEPDAADEKTGRFFRRGDRKLVFLCLWLAAGIGGYFLVHYFWPAGPKGCMIWAGDHYEPADCGDRSAAIPLRAIDHELVDYFRRITRPDTLTPFSIGKVWYAKYHGRVEFYTGKGSGLHPLDSTRRLLPMTDYILEKYIYHIRN
ncbi:hypothetical protein [Mucilaginibacter ginsenosidivorans]|uniref:Uncharacterized protein n=1 Tax=Mucilaginibacter ginsenosidivorans TaxID=398053 RepID=A0A5B8UTQ9_9SPHI|nr:hypothetical protein [Mucilaginibacter ginsenosidivorans]QEC62500.1 hypothetical protein FRZ54_07830 [Mucilaginibacter ginsenosidivorans]